MATTQRTTDLADLFHYYGLCARAEGKSPSTIAAAADALRSLERFLLSQGLDTGVAAIGPHEIRGFILHLQEKRCYAGHRFARPQNRGLTPHTVNSYLRSVKAFWSWLLREGYLERSPFEQIKIPKAPHKVVPTFSDSQIAALLAAINTSTAGGFRDYVIVLTLLDTGLRVSELAGLKLDDVRLDEGMVMVMGKGGRQRLIPIGTSVQRLLWRYISRYRTDPQLAYGDRLFLTAEGRPMTRNRIGSKLTRYGSRAGLSGVRCSPHTLRHTAAVRFLRNGGDAFSLQRLLGHATLAMTRHYCELADTDVKRAHSIASPVDNLMLKPEPTPTPSRRRIEPGAAGRQRDERAGQIRYGGHPAAAKGWGPRSRELPQPELDRMTVPRAVRPYGNGIARWPRIRGYLR